jgi:hypothetical protein
MYGCPRWSGSLLQLAPHPRGINMRSVNLLYKRCGEEYALCAFPVILSVLIVAHMVVLGSRRLPCDLVVPPLGSDLAHMVVLGLGAFPVTLSFLIVTHMVVMSIIQSSSNRDISSPTESLKFLLTHMCDLICYKAFESPPYPSRGEYSNILCRAL